MEVIQVERINLLKKYLDQACNNLMCYSRSLLMTEPKPGVEKEWKEAREEIQLLEEMINEVGTEKTAMIELAQPHIKEEELAGWIDTFNKRFDEIWEKVMNEAAVDFKDSHGVPTVVLLKDIGRPGTQGKVKAVEISTAEEFITYSIYSECSLLNDIKKLYFERDEIMVKNNASFSEREAFVKEFYARVSGIISDIVVLYEKLELVKSVH